MSLCGEIVLLQMIIVCCLAAVDSVTITTPCCCHPPAWLVFWWRRNQVISQNIACLFPLTLAIRYPANVSSWHSEVIFSSVLGVAVTHPQGLGSISACLLSLFPVCVFYMMSPARCASCYIHKSPCEVCTPHLPSALAWREGGRAVSKHPRRLTSILQYWQFCQSQKGFFIRRKRQRTAIKFLLAIVAEHCGVGLQSLCHLFFKINILNKQNNHLNICSDSQNENRITNWLLIYSTGK